MNFCYVPPERVTIRTRADLARCRHWASAFAGERKDHRYYELVEDTLHPEFEYRYFAIEDGAGTIRAIQPFFILDQDLCVGAGARLGKAVERVRLLWPRFMRLRTLMVGCVAGEGHLDAADEPSGRSYAGLLAEAIVQAARDLGARLVVLKEFPAKYRASLRCFLAQGFTRLPSMPMTRVGIEYASFEDYMNRALNSATRTKLRRKFRATRNGPAVEMSVVADVSPVIDEIYPLYLNVYERSKLRFEKLTKEYLCALGQRMPDKTRFFLWRREGRIVAFAVCLLQGRSFCPEYIGLDYALALDLHLYHCAYRDMVSWAIAQGYNELRSSGLNYDPKLHFRHVLDPLDLYVRHTSRAANAALRLLLPWLDPTRNDAVLPKFPNFHELRGAG